ncbi:hypothetical protein [Gynuella sunshinyii]|uniref:Uncharacterized protein n=1 Tax=Gynuella sunshinyii YC6258 TaxID=1445510 RepID=A0A0C5VIV5_9GAMM|nr:hypothetical protein [Gynuella sunshinyii]AJQ94191.1 hypothetical Protein YC6258_02153 [Gynuella sunshinyii YC6258]
MINSKAKSINDVVDGFIDMLTNEELDEFKNFIPNPMIKQKIDFYDYVVSKFDLKNDGQWIVEKLSEEFPIESQLLGKYDSYGNRLLDWEVDMIIKLAREKLGLTFEK